MLLQKIKKQTFQSLNSLSAKIIIKFTLKEWKKFNQGLISIILNTFQVCFKVFVNLKLYCKKKFKLSVKTVCSNVEYFFGVAFSVTVCLCLTYINILGLLYNPRYRLWNLTITSSVLKMIYAAFVVRLHEHRKKSLHIVVYGKKKKWFLLIYYCFKLFEIHMYQ